MQIVLDLEVSRLSEMSAEQLVNDFTEVNCYRIESHGRSYQVEVQVLEDENDYVHVGVAVDDGHLPHSVLPLSQSFIQKRVGTQSDI